MDSIAIWNFSNYRNDIDAGAGFHFNSSQPRIHTSIDIGDSLWLVTRVVIDGKNEYRLAAHLVVRAKTINAPSYKYGSYRVWGEMGKSSYFRIDESTEHDVFELLRILEMDSGTLSERTRTNLFHSMQTVRNIPRKSSDLLYSFASQLPLETRVYQVVDESELESLYAVGSLEQIGNFVEEQGAGYSESAKSKLRDGYERNRKLVTELNALYQGRCQVTGHDSPVVYSVPTAEAHHIVYRSRGGADDLENIVLVCPNIHSAIHSADATFDYAKLAFVFPNGRVEPLVINSHLKRRAA